MVGDNQSGDNQSSGNKCMVADCSELMVNRGYCSRHSTGKSLNWALIYLSGALLYRKITFTEGGVNRKMQVKLKRMSMPSRHAIDEADDSSLDPFHLMVKSFYIDSKSV